MFRLFNGASHFSNFRYSFVSMWNLHKKNSWHSFNYITALQVHTIQYNDA